MHTTQMLETSPQQMIFDQELLARTIDACFDCVQACTSCADACLGEESPQHLARCIALNDTCADVCQTTGRALSRPLAADDQMLAALLEACAQACRTCAEECLAHTEHEHCRVCAEACRSCQECCEELVEAAA